MIATGVPNPEIPSSRQPKQKPMTTSTALGIPGALAIDTAIFGQFSQAGSSLQAAVAAFHANPGSAPYCPALNAQSAAAMALIGYPISIRRTRG